MMIIAVGLIAEVEITILHRNEFDFGNRMCLTKCRWQFDNGIKFWLHDQSTCIGIESRWATSTGICKDEQTKSNSHLWIISF